MLRGRTFSVIISLQYTFYHAEYLKSYSISFSMRLLFSAFTTFGKGLNIKILFQSWASVLRYEIDLFARFISFYFFNFSFKCVPFTIYRTIAYIKTTDWVYFTCGKNKQKEKLSRPTVIYRMENKSWFSNHRCI